MNYLFQVVTAESIWHAPSAYNYTPERDKAEHAKSVRLQRETDELISSVLTKLSSEGWELVGFELMQNRYLLRKPVAGDQ